MSASIDANRVIRRLHELSGFVDSRYPGWTRRSFSPIYQDGRSWIRQQMESAGLTVSLDAAANMIGAQSGSDASLSALLVGSHSDTVIGGGRFDGMVGVVGAIEVAQALQDYGITLRHPLKVCDFLGEEPSDYGVSCIGSRAAAGQLSQTMLNRIGPDQTTLAAGIDCMGGDAAHIDKARMDGALSGAIELHIEQGSVLEQVGVELGIVTALPGIHRFSVQVKGREGHAGTTPMAQRRDALAGAAIIVTRVNEWARSLDGEVVATFGTITITPNAMNVIPGKAMLGLEVRALDNGRLVEAEDVLRRTAEAVRDQHQVEVRVDRISHEGASQIRDQAQVLLEASMKQRKIGYLRLPSWAGHDSVYINQIAPISGMIFIPSRDGLSHCPEEWSSERWIAQGTQALLDAVLYWDMALQSPDA